MKLSYTERFLKSHAAAPQHVQQAFEKQVGLLAENLRHPSIRAKKYDAARDIWQGRVTRSWHFYFTIEGDTYHTSEHHFPPEVADGALRPSVQSNGVDTPPFSRSLRR